MLRQYLIWEASSRSTAWLFWLRLQPSPKLIYSRESTSFPVEETLQNTIWNSNHILNHNWFFFVTQWRLAAHGIPLKTNHSVGPRGLYRKVDKFQCDTEYMNRMVWREWLRKSFSSLFVALCLPVFFLYEAIRDENVVHIVYIFFAIIDLLNVAIYRASFKWPYCMTVAAVIIAARFLAINYDHSFELSYL